MVGKKMAKGIGLLSGGLDSILAVKVLQEQDIDVTCVRFTTPFFSSTIESDTKQVAGTSVRLVDIGERHLSMLKNPVYGYGSQMNPCIDCHALMLREAGTIMEQMEADFLFTGEVLGQRPMSQRRDSLRSVENLAGYPGRILRPLSAKLLPPTVMETEGMIDRDRLLDIQGRSRKRQMALAERYGIRDYAQPGGGCMLTKEGFARKLKTLLQQMPSATTREVELLKWGRHFRLPGGNICVIGRNQTDNERLESLARDRDVSLITVDFPGPYGLIVGSSIAEQNFTLAAGILAAYSDAPSQGTVRVLWKHGGKSGIRLEEATAKDHFKHHAM